MARHRRYPVKKKIKPGDVDPLRSSKPKPKNRFNAPPCDADEQPLSRRLKEIRGCGRGGCSTTSTVVQQTTQSTFFALTAKSGFKQRPWEDVDQLASRVVRSKNNDLNAEIMKARMGMGGRDVKELDADFRELDEKARQRRAMKVPRSRRQR